MEKNFEQSREEELLHDLEEAKSQEQVVEKQEIPLEEKVDVAVGRQDDELSQRELRHDKKALSGLRKWIGVATVMGASFLAVGCNSEKSGFTDNVHDNVQQRVKIKKAEIEHMKKTKGYEPSVQPDKSGFTDETSAQRPSTEVKTGPSGRVSNPEDL